MSNDYPELVIDLDQRLQIVSRICDGIDVRLDVVNGERSGNIPIDGNEIEILFRREGDFEYNLNYKSIGRNIDLDKKYVHFEMTPSGGLGFSALAGSSDVDMYRYIISAIADGAIALFDVKVVYNNPESYPYGVVWFDFVKATFLKSDFESILQPGLRDCP